MSAYKSSNDEIAHRATVMKVDGEWVTVGLSLKANECAQCHMSAMCNRPEKLRIRLKDATPSLAGKEVLIGASPMVRHLAQWCYLGVPIVLILLSLVACHLASLSQQISALISVAAVCLWFAALYLLRSKLDFSSRFNILRIL